MYILIQSNDSQSRHTTIRAATQAFMFMPPSLNMGVILFVCLFSGTHRQYPYLTTHDWLWNRIYFTTCTKERKEQVSQGCTCPARDSYGWMHRLTLPCCQVETWKNGSVFNEVGMEGTDPLTLRKRGCCKWPEKIENGHSNTFQGCCCRSLGCH